MAYEAGITDTGFLEQFVFFDSLPEREHTQVLLAWTPKNKTIEWTETAIDQLEALTMGQYDGDEVSINAAVVRFAYAGYWT